MDSRSAISGTPILLLMILIQKPRRAGAGKGGAEPLLSTKGRPEDFRDAAIGNILRSIVLSFTIGRELQISLSGSADSGR
jgi:hypothetical protein